MRRLRVLVIGTALAGCSLITKFDQDGQPCDKSEPNPALTCLSDAGYACVDGFCKRSPTSGTQDAGPGLDGGSDGGNVGG